MTEARAIVTATFGEAHRRIGEVSLPLIRAYAERIGAKLFVLEHRIFSESWHLYWEKLQLGRILQEYQFDRAAWIDVDTIVHPKAPDIFAETPPNDFCAFDEGKVFSDRTLQLYEDAPFYGLRDVVSHSRDFVYFNVGVMVVPWSMRGVFNAPSRPKRDSIMPEQTYLNLKVALAGLPFHDLGIRWNGLHSIRGPLERKDLWIVHYAGWPRTSDLVDRMTAQMRTDLKGWSS